MAYIPTIHTFEDDINENRGFDEAPISGGIETITNQSSILVPAQSESSSVTKKIFTLISVIFILGSLSTVGYYFYNNYKTQQAIDLANQQALAMKAADDAAQSSQNNLAQIFPLLAPGINSYIKTFSQKDNLIILTIKPNDSSNNTDNYSQLYAYILAHQKDLGKDLAATFNLDQIAANTANNLTSDSLITDNSSTTSQSDSVSSTTLIINNSTTSKKNNKNKVATSSSLVQVVNFFDPNNLQKQISSAINSAAPVTLVSPENLVWENKTLNNQDFQIANAGVVTLIYGYVKNNNYIVFATSLKDFFDAINGLQ
ncbi:MAG: hypothetical protein WCO35_03565 [Candidatus Nomurabacteria bacterium]